MSLLSSSAQKIQDYLQESGIETQVLEVQESTKTAKEAADFVGCDVAQIAKSIMFKSASGTPVLVITSGPNRVNEKKVVAALGEDVKFADPEFVKNSTGFVIGGVPPFHHQVTPHVFIDKDLTDHSEVWAAAGTPHSLFKIKTADLLRLSSAKPLDIK